MDKATQRALEKYPKRKDGQTRGYVCDDNDVRRIYSQGYRRAEKDLALTWEDVKAIFKIADNYDSELNRPKYLTQEYCKEILNRFNEQRERNESK